MKRNDFARISVSRFCEEFWSGNLCNVASTEKYKSDRRKYTKCYIMPYFGNTLLREHLADFFKRLKATETRFYTIAKKRNRLGSFRRNQFLSDGTIGVIRATLFAPLATSGYRSNRRRCVSKRRIGKGTELYGYIREKLCAY